MPRANGKNLSINQRSDLMRANKGRIPIENFEEDRKLRISSGVRRAWFEKQNPTHMRRVGEYTI